METSISLRNSTHKKKHVFLVLEFLGVPYRFGPCANLAQNSGCVKSSRVKSQDYTQQFNSMSMASYHSKSIDIHSKSCLLKLTIPLQARGPTYQANNATRKQRNSSPISSRPIMLCNPFRCIFIHFCFNFLRDFGLARKLART